MQHHVPGQAAHVPVYEVVELLQRLCGVISSVGIDGGGLSDGMLQQLSYFLIRVTDAFQSRYGLRMLSLRFGRCIIIVVFLTGSQHVDGQHCYKP